VLLRGAMLAGELTLHGARIKSVASAGPGLGRDATGTGPGVQPGTSPTASASPSASGSQPSGRTPRAGAAADPGPAECGVAGRAGYALDLVLPFTGQPGPCTASTAPGLLAFGWLVRVLAITLLAVYVAGLTRRHPGPS
jgi:hypothetical protein